MQSDLGATLSDALLHICFITYPGQNNNVNIIFPMVFFPHTATIHFINTILNGLMYTMLTSYNTESIMFVVDLNPRRAR